MGLGVYSKTVSRDEGIKEGYLRQKTAYQLLGKHEWVSFLCEERSSGQFNEFRLALDLKLADDVVAELDRLNAHVDGGTLPPMLDDCTMRLGQVYRECPYRKHCPTVNQDNEPIKKGT
jgi:hypothetical protein